LPDHDGVVPDFVAVIPPVVVDDIQNVEGGGGEVNGNIGWNRRK
jgi:hypothetical protein